MQFDNHINQLLEAMSRRSFFSNIGKSIAGAAIGSNFFNLEKLTALTAAPGKEIWSWVAVDGNFRVLGPAATRVGGSSSFWLVMDAFKNPNVHLSSLSRPNQWTFMVKSSRSFKNLSPDTVFLKDIAKSVYEDAYKMEGGIITQLEHDVKDYKFSIKESKELRDNLQIDLVKYKEYTGNEMPAEVRDRLLDLVDGITKKTEIENQVSQYKLAFKHWVHHHYPHKFSDDNREGGDVRGIGEKVTSFKQFYNLILEGKVDPFYNSFASKIMELYKKKKSSPAIAKELNETDEFKKEGRKIGAVTVRDIIRRNGGELRPGGVVPDELYSSPSFFLKIKKLYLDDEWGTPEIVEYLNKTDEFKKEGRTVSIQTINNILTRNGIKLRPSGFIPVELYSSPTTLSIIKDLYGRKWSFRRIAKYLNEETEAFTDTNTTISATTVRDIYTRNGGKLRPRGTIPDELLKASTPEMLDMYRNGSTYREITNHLNGTDPFLEAHRTISIRTVRRFVQLDKIKFADIVRYRIGTDLDKILSDSIRGESTGTDFSKYKFKLENRITEFKSLIPYFQKFNGKNINIFSLPYEYAFEKTLKKVIPTAHFNVYAAEKIKPLKWVKDQAKKFADDTGSDVFLCAKQLKGRDITFASKIATTQISDPSFTQQWMNINTNKISNPENFQVVDLDYVSTYRPSSPVDIKYFWEKLSPGGVMLITFSHTDQYLNTDLQNIKQKYINDGMPEKEVQDIIDSFTFSTRFDTKDRTFFNPSDNQLTQFGLPRNSSTENMLGSINHIAKEVSKGITGKEPIYINAYKGGESAQGTKMFRLGYVK